MALSLKLAIVSGTVLSTAVMLKLLSPFIMDFAVSDLPTIWTSLIAWLKPPYLYVVINCIIITIVASSRLQSKFEGSHSFSTYPTPVQHVEPVKVVQHIELTPAVIPFHTDSLVNEPVMISNVSVYNNSPKFVQVVPEQDFGLLENKPVKVSTGSYDSGAQFVHASEPDLVAINELVMDDEMRIAKQAYEEIKRNSKVKKSVISMSTWTPSKMNQVDLSSPMAKPPASARFSHRKQAKANLEGGRTLGVAKPKKQETLESTWKTITEGRGVPLTRHLRKSDTWETHGQRDTPNSEDLSIDHDHSERMTKSDTFNVNKNISGRGSSKKPPPLPSKLSRSGGSGRLKKEPSLGQEELNRKVEAFIKKFNEDMRLQRQESMNQYMEMINRGAQ
uniref:uncharacterized protein LOC122593784 n=1 Tax=Erigeron canadensis TaxID=72917 RepID=UPI001CB972FF|nr:uncharacterized protein LOC122593784 [Erigeron canadensis]